MRKRQVSNVVTQSCHSQYPPPVVNAISILRFRNELPYVISNRISSSHYIEYPGSELHHSQGMFKSFMGRARIQQVSEGQLSDVPQTLKRARIEDSPLLRVISDEDMNRVPHLVYELGHFVSQKYFTLNSIPGQCFIDWTSPLDNITTEMLRAPRFEILNSKKVAMLRACFYLLFPRSLGPCLTDIYGAACARRESSL